MDFQQEQQLEDSNNKAPFQPTFNTNSASPSRLTSEPRIAQEGNNTHTTLGLSPKEKTSHITIDKSNLPPPYPLQPNSDHCAINSVGSSGSKPQIQQYPPSNTSHLKKYSNSGTNTPKSTPKSKQRRSEMNIQDNPTNQRSIYETHYSSAQNSPIEQIRAASQVPKKEQHITVTYSECVNPMSFQTEPTSTFHPSQPNVSILYLLTNIFLQLL
ncbi:uncharacterized protein LOC142358509 [Convolutriloba macropyga]|uniref:uncharacterized protein LOC142358509 n=1 Tax=Convolutriloba macropyga TaxID=536237 RepID=UPI003F528BA3